MRFAASDGMGVQRLEDLIAWQLAVKFKLEVYRLVSTSRTAQRDLGFRDQLFEAACGAEMTIAEGFARYSAGQMVQFFGYARASLAEAKRRLHDGASRTLRGHQRPARPAAGDSVRHRDVTLPAKPAAISPASATGAAQGPTE